MCFAPVLTMSEAAEHPHNVARQTFIEVAGIRQPAPAPRFSRTGPEVAAPPAHAGQHTREMLRDWGLAADVVDAPRSPRGRLEVAPMATLVCFHAHPDDEAHRHRWDDGAGPRRRATAWCWSSPRTASTARCRRTSATVRRSSTPARGDRGARPPHSASTASVWLGYSDSGMTGWEQNADPSSFLQADVDDAAEPPGRGPAARRRPTSSRPTTGTATTATRTTSRSTTSGTGPPSWPGRAGVRGDDEPRSHRADDAAAREPTRSSSSTRGVRPQRPGRRRQPASACPRSTSRWPSTSRAYVGQKRAAIAAHRSQVTDTTHVPADARGGLPGRVRHRVVHREGCRGHRPPPGLAVPLTGSACTSSATAAPRPAGTTIPIRRSTTSAARRPTRWPSGWPPRSGGPCRSSPARCCAAGRPRRRRAAVGRSTSRSSRSSAEIPSPEGVADGGASGVAAHAMAGRWRELGPRYVGFRDAVVGCLLAATAPTVVVSHFVAINAAIGAALGDDRMVLRVAGQLLGHGDRRGRRRAPPRRGRPRGRHAHPLTGQDGV